MQTHRQLGESQTPRDNPLNKIGKKCVSQRKDDGDEEGMNDR